MLAKININDYLKKCEKDDIVLTKFLDTAESSNFRIFKNPAYNIYFEGGFEEAERVRVILTKKGVMPPAKSEFEIAILKIEINSKNRPITHRHVLGTILSLGIKRDTIGDIIINELDSSYVAYVFIDKIMENYLKTNITSINNVLVDVEIVDISGFVNNVKHNIEFVNVASLRLDGLIAHAMKISRTKAENIIENGDVQINHIDCLSPSKQLKENDLISIKHFGRISILEIVNITKKQRLVIKIDIKH